MASLFFISAASAGGAGTGNVTGPAGATDSAIALYDGATGTLIKNSVVTIDGAGNVTVPGTVDGRDIAADGAKLDTIATGATATPLSAVAPVDVTKAAAAVGVSTSAARSDHKHDISTAVVIDITDSTNAEGVATSLARSDHTHGHGNRGGGALHADVIAAGASGFMTGADKTKLDGIATGATATPLSAVAPVDVTKAAAAVGVSTSAARSDHKHDISTAVVIDITDSTNAEGVATSLARSDHTHGHGNRGGGTLHAVAVASGAAGFMSGTDKAKLDALPVTGSASLVLWGANSIAATTTTRYLFPSFANATADTSVVQYRAPRAGTLQSMRVRQNSPAGNGNAVVYTLRVNSAPTALSVSMASTAADGSDLVNTVAIAAGDLLGIEVTKAASIGSSPSNIVVSMELV